MADLFAVNDDTKREDTPHFHGHRGRLRERFLNEPKALPDYEVLEIILFAASARKDVKPLAKALLKHFGSLPRVLMASADELLRIDGLNHSGVAAIKSVQEAASRLLLSEAKEKPVLNSWIKLLDYCRAEMGHLKTEQFRLLFLNSKNMLIADEVQQEGTVNHTMAYPREVVKRALELAASSIILAHNHPSGDASPSKADIDLPEQIATAAKTLGVRVHDHLIITENEHFSFRSAGLIS